MLRTPAPLIGALGFTLAMCYFMTFATPHEMSIERSRAGLLISPYPQRKSGHRYEGSLFIYSITEGGCSCPLVHIPHEASDGVNTQRILEAKYRKAGWSEAKAQRAAADSIAKRKPDSHGLRGDVRQMLTQLTRSHGRLEFIIHFHNGDFLDDKFEVSSEETMHAENLNEAFTPKPDCRYIVSMGCAGET